MIIGGCLVVSTCTAPLTRKGQRAIGNLRMLTIDKVVKACSAARECVGDVSTYIRNKTKHI